MSKTIGVIGLGSIGSRHANNLKELGCHVWVLDTDIYKRLEHGYDLCGSKLADIIEADAFVIASPTSTHANYISNLMWTDKFIFVEKPLADEGVLFGEEAGKKLFVGYNLRFHSCVKKAKEWIDAGFLGQPLWGNFVVGQFNDRPDYHRDGVILNWSHEIDLATYLLGSGHVAGSSTRLNNGQDDLTDILFTHDNGCRSTIHLDYITKPEIRQSLIVGSEATIILDIVHREAWLRSKDAIMLDHQGVDDSFEENYVEEMQAFLDRIDGKETIGCDGNEAREVLKICLEVRKQSGL